MMIAPILFFAQAFLEQRNPMTDQLMWSAGTETSEYSAKVYCSSDRREPQFVFNVRERLLTRRIRASGYYEGLWNVRFNQEQPVQMRFYIDGRDAVLVGYETAAVVTNRLAQGDRAVVELRLDSGDTKYLTIGGPSYVEPFTKIVAKCNL